MNINSFSSISDLREVYRVAKRIEDHINSSTSTNQLILELIGDIESTWTTLVKIFERQSIEVTFGYAVIQINI